MSVIYFKKEELQKLANQVYSLAQGGRNFRLRNFDERIEFKGKYGETPKDELLKYEVFEFVNRVSLANQLAFNRTYVFRDGNYKAEVEMYDITPVVENINPKWLFKEIGSIGYNCVSNGGQCYLTKMDDEIFNDIKLLVANIEFNDERHLK